MPMFKDKALQVTMVKKEDGTPIPETITVKASSENIDKAGEVAKDVIGAITASALIFVAADTVRKVIIELVKK